MFKTLRNSTPQQWLMVVVIILAAYVVVDWTLGKLAKQYVNRRVFANAGRYQGYVTHVDLHLWKCSYTVKNLTIRRKDGSEELPFAVVDHVDTKISWLGLLQGEVLMSAEIEGLTLNFVDAKKDEDQQFGRGTNWLNVFDKIIPSPMDQVRITDANIRLLNRDTNPPVDVEITDIEVKITNLNNVAEKTGEKVADAKLQGKIFGQSPLRVDAVFDPFEFDDLALTAEIRDIDLTEANTLAQAYGHADFKSGSGEVAVELQVNGGKIDGYIMPLFEDVDIISWSQDVIEQHDNPLELAWEGLLGIGTIFLTNLGTDKIATRIGISGTLKDAEISTWRGFFGFLENAFIDGFNVDFEKLDAEETKALTSVEMQSKKSKAK